MHATIKPYSIAVAPRSSLRNFTSKIPMGVPFLGLVAVEQSLVQGVLSSYCTNRDNSYEWRGKPCDFLTSI